MNRYPLWINILVLAVIVGGALFALPNLYGDDPALQITREDGNPMTDIVRAQIVAALDEQEIQFASVVLEDEVVVARFPDVATQLSGSEALGEALPFHIVALTLAPRTPGWLRFLGLEPMSLGLDLRGGVHFLYQVDLDSALDQFMQTYQTDLRTRLREENIRNGGVNLEGRAVSVGIQDPERMDDTEEIIRVLDPQASQTLLGGTPGIDVNRTTIDGLPGFRVAPTQMLITQRQDFAIQQNTITCSAQPGQ